MPRKRKGDDKGGEPPERKPAGKRAYPPGNPDADPVGIHRDYVERRLGGETPATPEAYARAIKQWHALPGAVSVPPTEVAGDEGDPTPGESKADNASSDDEQPA
jgi:hypothetical protein